MELINENQISDIIRRIADPDHGSEMNLLETTHALRLLISQSEQNFVEIRHCSQKAIECILPVYFGEKMKKTSKECILHDWHALNQHTRFVSCALSYIDTYIICPSIFLPQIPDISQSICHIHCDFFDHLFSQADYREILCEAVETQLINEFPEIPNVLKDVYHSYAALNMRFERRIDMFAFKDPLSNMLKRLCCQKVENSREKACHGLHISLKYLHSLLLEDFPIFHGTMVLTFIADLWPFLAPENESTTYMDDLFVLIVNSKNLKFLSFLIEVRLLVGDDEYVLSDSLQNAFISYYRTVIDYPACQECLSEIHKHHLVLTRLYHTYEWWFSKSIEQKEFNIENGVRVIRFSADHALRRTLDVKSFLLASGGHLVYPQDFPEAFADKDDTYCYFKMTHLLPDCGLFLSMYVSTAFYRVVATPVANLEKCLSWEAKILENIKSVAKAEHRSILEKLSASLWALRASASRANKEKYPNQRVQSRYYALSSSAWASFFSDSLPYEEKSLSRILPSFNSASSFSFAPFICDNLDVEKIVPALCFLTVRVYGKPLTVSTSDAKIIQLIAERKAIHINDLSTEISVSVDEIQLFSGIGGENSLFLWNTAKVISINSDFTPTLAFYEGLYSRYIHSDSSGNYFTCRKVP